MPRLDKLQIWPKIKILPAVIGVSIFVAGAFGYLFSASDGTKNFLSATFWISNGIIYFFLAVSLVSATLSKLKPRWEMVPLVLANAGFLYLWWLSTLLFDLVYIWHQFIRSFRTTAVLRNLRAEAGSDLKAKNNR